MKVGEINDLVDLMFNFDFEELKKEKSILELINKQKQEIDRLNNENKQYKEYIKELKDSLKNYHIKNNKLINKNERLNNIIDKTKENINDNINLLKTGVKRNSKHITITEAISILETILIQMN